VKKEATHKDEATILSKTVDQLGLNGMHPIGDFQPDREPKFTRFDDVFRG
jgi:hypothetical protein